MSRRDRQYRDDLRSIATMAYNMERKPSEKPKPRCPVCCSFMYGEPPACVICNEVKP